MGEHKYWRILVTANDGGLYIAGQIAELTFLNNGSVVSTGGTPFASSVFGPAYPPENAFDGDASTDWVSSYSMEFPYSIGYEFAAPVAVTTLQIQASASNQSRAPAEFKIQYSDNGSDWFTTEAGVQTSVAWAAGEAREFSTSLTVDLQTNLEATRFQSGVVLREDRTRYGYFELSNTTSILKYALPALADSGLIQFYAFDSDEGDSIFKTELLDPETITALTFEKIYSASTGATDQSSKVSGIVQIDGTPAQRTVRAFGYAPTAHEIDGNTISQSKSLGHATSDPQTGEYSIDLLGGYGKEIFVVAFDDYGSDFQPDLAVAVGDRIHPTTPNGYVWECAGAGTLPSEEPAWIIDTETAQLYGTASMITRPFYRPMVHGPVKPEVIEPEPEP